MTSCQQIMTLHDFWECLLKLAQQGPTNEWPQRGPWPNKWMDPPSGSNQSALDPFLVLNLIKKKKHCPVVEFGLFGHRHDVRGVHFHPQGVLSSDLWPADPRPAKISGFCSRFCSSAVCLCSYAVHEKVARGLFTRLCR